MGAIGSLSVAIAAQLLLDDESISLPPRRASLNAAGQLIYDTIGYVLLRDSLLHSEKPGHGAVERRYDVRLVEAVLWKCVGPGNDGDVLVRHVSYRLLRASSRLAGVSVETGSKIFFRLAPAYLDDHRLQVSLVSPFLCYLHTVK